jgi:hypothetical protein
VGKHVHTQAVAGTLWTIDHTLNTQDFVITLWDSSKNIIQGEIVSISDTQIQVSFEDAQSGKAVIIG